MCRGLTISVALVALVGVVGVALAQAGQNRDPSLGLGLIKAVKTGNDEASSRLLEQSVAVEESDPDGSTALHWASHLDKVSVAGQLLEAGADVQATNRNGITPLTLAATNASAAMVALLLDAGADPNTTTPGGETVLMTAARTGATDVVELLLGKGADVHATEGWRGQTALMWAAAQNQSTSAEALIRAGAALDARSEGGFTPLLFSAREGHIEALHVLLEAGADPDDTLPNGTNALVLATYNAHYDLVQVLLGAGADPNAADQGWTALHQVVWTRRPNLGRNPPFPVPSGRLDGLDMARTLVEYGAELDARQSKEPRDGNRNVLDRVGATPFLLSAKAADVEMMRLLADLGADPMLTTEEGATPLMAAAGVGIWKIGENPGTNEEALAAVRLAWELGNDVNASDVNGDTALHGALHRGAGNIVQFLVEKGADVDATNEIGWTPLSIAQGVFYPNTFNRHPDIVGLLQELGADPQAGSRRPEDLAPWERAATAEAR